MGGVSRDLNRISGKPDNTFHDEAGRLSSSGIPNNTAFLQGDKIEYCLDGAYKKRPVGISRVDYNDDIASFWSIESGKTFLEQRQLGAIDQRCGQYTVSLLQCGQHRSRIDSVGGDNKT